MKQFSNSFFSKKSLGQNFLTSKQVVFDLLHAAEIGSNDTVLEVGPGRGFITEELVKISKRVIAVEKDETLAEFLKKRFSKEISAGKLDIVCVDILIFPFSSYKLRTMDYKLIGAIPYYITGKLFRTVLENTVRPKTVALIIQKEVAERVVAKDERASLLSLGVQAFGTPRYVRTVPARDFSPSPKVDSAILVVKDISDEFFRRRGIREKRFFDIARAGFAHKRKILLSSLKGALALPTDALLQAFVACDIPLKTRPEDVPLEKWGCLARKLESGM